MNTHVDKTQENKCRSNVQKESETKVSLKIKLIVDLAYKNPGKDRKDFENVNRYLKAAGVNKKKLFLKNGDPKKQISILLDAFRQSEL